MTEDGAPVYNNTVTPNTDKEGRTCVGWLHLKQLRFFLKLSEVVLSFVAFICEELVEHCTNCGALYFFEFMSCTAFLMSVVVIVVYSTKIAEKVILSRLQIWDSCFTLIVGVLFILASVIFAATNYGSTLESISIAFGFLASLAFLIDCFLLWKKDNVLLWRKNTEKGKARPSGLPGETRPLQEVVQTESTTN
ncbi:CKLF-like MARVEL transmembrane domain-containing protein 6 [Pleurodeles waltl]|uniref:CKLF-like MARVEL transmembrane domain-containing protein 6 n=1 Tax=Pleurodeles waltl TaxID=8319 RepID=UPI0037099D73